MVWQLAYRYDAHRRPGLVLARRDAKRWAAWWENLLKVEIPTDLANYVQALVRPIATRRRKDLKPHTLELWKQWHHGRRRYKHESKTEVNSCKACTIDR